MTRQTADPKLLPAPSPRFTRLTRASAAWVCTKNCAMALFSSVVDMGCAAPCSVRPGSRRSSTLSGWRSRRRRLCGSLRNRLGRRFKVPDPDERQQPVTVLAGFLALLRRDLLAPGEVPDRHQPCAEGE